MTYLEELIGSRSKITLLRHLCVNADKDFSISELADNSGLDKSLVSRIIQQLATSNIILVRERRNLKLCQINTDNRLYKVLADMFQVERYLFRKKGGS